MTPLAFIVLLVSDPQIKESAEIHLRERADCKTVGAHYEALLESQGFEVDVLCIYGSGPMTSQRPVAW